ncbi:hypothetical protein RvY_09369 [Ramazzottius varieornatus]|uniref:Hsp90 chaperone protein kinase-targeting subunit n=1 Tax=Ramazzottius varieornatus TaxID=947166 RepID=A0A1D1VB96_RAMVA|nr:hypothetical protein RvY_09369 [Ramazzottius varieornatus]
MPVDYSKWKTIEVSDDEDDTHPNVDTGSLFRWRHQARVERMDEFQERKKKAQDEYDAARKEVERKKASLKDNSADAAKAALDDALKSEAAAKDKLDEVLKEEKKQAWNVDTISKERFSKTIINKTTKPSKNNMTEEEKEQHYLDFIEKNETDIKKFAFFRNYDDSKNFLSERSHLVCEETANYLVLMCLNLEMEGKTSLMEHVAHQSIVMQFILELAKQLDIDPRACIGSFFSRIKLADKQYKDAFNDEYTAFKQRIQDRAKVKIEQALAEQEAEERQARLGPGGLDPLEVIEELPEELRKCFESRDTQLLKDVLAKMDKQKAVEYMDKCIKSGLWVPEGGEGDDANNNIGNENR